MLEEGDASFSNESMAGRLLSLSSRHDDRRPGPGGIRSQPNLISKEPAFGSPATRTKSLPSNLLSKPGKYVLTGESPMAKATLNWERLPAHLLEVILDKLRMLHLGYRARSCSTCCMRDLVSMQMTCKAWFSDAQKRLYTDIEIVGDDDPTMLRRQRLFRGARLVRLRSTLRSKPLLAALVKTLHVPDPHVPLYLPNDDPNPDYDAYLCILASVVMGCPNLECLTGFQPFYNHTFDRLTHALSTRTKLRQHVWIIAENDDISQLYQFTHYHDRWLNLETLMLCSPAGLGVVEHGVFVEVLHSLPSLQNLGISSFDADDFHDLTLLSLPAVRRLRLEECSGVTEYGLTKWAASPNAFRIEALILLHQAITSLSTLSKVLASLAHLTKFTISQDDVAPAFTPEEELLVLQPTLASPSLRVLHWDIRCKDHGTGGTRASRTGARASMSANAHLALSIQHQGFPFLAYLRAPRDTVPYGALQAVCLPAADNNFLLPRDKRGLHEFRANPYSSSLQVARIRAQRMAQRSLQQQAFAHSPKTAPQTLKEVPIIRRKPVGGVYGLVTASTDTSLETIDSRVSGASTNTTATSRDDMLPSTISRNGVEPWKRQETPESAVTGNYSHSNEPFDRAGQTPTPAPYPPPRHPLHFRASASFFSPRTQATSEQHTPGFHRPIFHLEPDVPGKDGNGGLVGWAELLGVREKAKKGAVTVKHDPSPAGTSPSQVASESSSDYGVSLDTRDDADADAPICTGSWNRARTLDTDTDEDEDSYTAQASKIIKILTATTTAAAASSSSSSSGSRARSRWRSKTKLSSRSAPSSSSSPSDPHASEPWKHVARPRGERGGAVDVDDFF